MLSIWLLDVGHLEKVSEAHGRTKSHSPAIECDTRIHNEEAFPTVEAEVREDAEIEVDRDRPLLAVG